MTNDSTKMLRTTAAAVLQKAIKLGAKEVRVAAHNSRNCSVEYRDGRPDKVQEASRRGLSVDLYIDGRFTSCTTCDLRTEALDRFLETSVAMCRAMAPDADRRLPDPELYVDLAAADAVR